jgi:hypothetical protein
MPMMAGAAALVALALYTSMSSGSAVLNVICRHSFRSAEISILIDGKPSYSGELFGTEKKRLGVGLLGKQVREAGVNFIQPGRKHEGFSARELR